MHMNINDFQYMWRGKAIRPLLDQEAYLLLPIDIRRRDSGRALLLLHGFSSSPAIYRELMPAFTLYDAVLCPVLPGHAHSIQSFAQATAIEWLDEAVQACQTLVQRYDQVDVMGLSLGGLLACKLGQEFTLHHLYLLAPALKLHGFTGFLLAVARFLRYLGLKRIPNHAGNFHTKGHEELTYRQLPLSAIVEILSLVQNNQFVMPSCPTDVFLGRHDEVVDSPAIAALFANKPNTTIHWLENSAHILPLDGDIQAIVECVEKNA